MSEPQAQLVPCSGYKHTDVGPIPDDWDVSTVGTEFTIQLGKMINAAKNVGASKPYVGNRAVQWGHIDLDAVALVRMSASDLQRYNLQRGDLLVCEGGEIGRAAIWNDELPECYFQKAIHRLRAKQSYDPFLMMSLLQLWASSGRLSNYVTQTSIAHLPKDKFQLVPVPLPSPPEQSAIHLALSDVDGLIDSLETLIEKKRAIKQGTIQQLLTAKTRLPGFHERWCPQLLGELANIQRGASPRPIHSPVWFDEQSSVGWVRIADVPASGMYLRSTTQRLSHRGVAHSHPVRPGSLLMSICATVGRPVITAIDACIHDGFVVFDNLKADTRFMYYMLRSIESTWSQHGQTGSQMNLNTGLIKRTKVQIPADEDEQVAIATVLADMDGEIETLEQHRNKVKHIKRGMMQQLLTGRVRLVKPQQLRTAVQTNATTDKAHSWAFNEAVVIAVLVKNFGTDQFPLGRKRYTKLAYLLHRHVEKKPEGYLKKTAGPYNPQTRYGGPERIALQNGYVREHKSGAYGGFVSADYVGKAEEYFEKWYGPDAIKWLEQFRFKKNDDLELMATVDMAAEELRAAGMTVDVSSVKTIIRGNTEWKAKLDRAVFSDSNIGQAITVCQSLFASAVGANT